MKLTPKYRYYFIDGLLYKNHVYLVAHKFNTCTDFLCATTVIFTEKLMLFLSK